MSHGAHSFGDLSSSRSRKHASLSFFAKIRLLFKSPDSRRISMVKRRLLQRFAEGAVILALASGVGYVLTRGPETPTFSFASFAPSGKPDRSPGTKGVVDEAGSSNPTIYKTQKGPLALRNAADVLLHDGGRNKDLRINVLYPSHAGSYPVIIFSRGESAPQSCCTEITRRWASYGYITIEVAHNDSAIQKNAYNPSIESVRFARPAGTKRLTLDETRAIDISFVIDSLPDLQRKIPRLAGKLNPQSVGVVGYGAGSSTAEAIAGALLTLPGRPATSFGDPRVRAVLCISPQGPGKQGLTDHSFEQLVLPYMGISPSLDDSGSRVNLAWQGIPFERSQAGDKYQIDIQGANQRSLISARKSTPSNSSKPSSIPDYTNAVTLAFWDAYLKHDFVAKNYLQSGALAKSSQGAIKIRRR
jgi:predicted dienelactone hydrolase